MSISRLFLLLVAAVAVVAVTILSSRARDSSSAQLCRERYAASRTAADTVAVDLARPFLGKSQAASALSCGELRRAHRL